MECVRICLLNVAFPHSVEIFTISPLPHADIMQFARHGGGGLNAKQRPSCPRSLNGQKGQEYKYFTLSRRAETRSFDYLISRAPRFSWPLDNISQHSRLLKVNRLTLYTLSLVYIICLSKGEPRQKRKYATLIIIHQDCTRQIYIDALFLFTLFTLFYYIIFIKPRTKIFFFLILQIINKL